MLQLYSWIENQINTVICCEKKHKKNTNQEIKRKYRNTQ